MGTNSSAREIFYSAPILILIHMKINQESKFEFFVMSNVGRGGQNQENCLLISHLAVSKFHSCVSM